MGSSENALGRAKKPWILYVLIGLFLVVGAVVVLTVIFPKQKKEEAPAVVRTQTQDALEDLINSITNDPNLTDEQKAMLISVFSALSAERIETMDDALLVIEKLITSPGTRLLVSQEIDDLTSLKDRINSGKVDDLIHVKTIIANVLDCIRSRISDEIQDLTVAGQALKTFISDIRTDSGLSDGQKTLFVDLLQNLGRGVSAYDLDQLKSDKEINTFMTKIIDNKILEDKDTKDLLVRITDGMAAGDKYDLQDLKHITGRVLYIIYNEQYLSEGNLELIKNLLADAGINLTDVNSINNIADAKALIERLINSGLITDETILNELNNMLNIINKGGNVSIEQLRQVIQKALNHIEQNIIEQKYQYFINQNAEGLVTYEYLQKIMNDYSKSFDYLKNITNQNTEDIENIYQQMADKDAEDKEARKNIEDRVTYLEDNVDANFDELVDAINDTNKDLADDINNTTGTLAKDYNNAQVETVKQVNQVNSEMVDSTNNVMTGMVDSTNGVITGLVTALNDRDATLVKNINKQNENLVSNINKENTRFAESVNLLISQTITASNGRQTSLVAAINASKTALVKSINEQNSTLLNSINTENNRFAGAINEQNAALVTSINNQQSALTASINAQNTALVAAMNAGNDQIISSLNAQTAALADSVNAQNEALVNSINAQNQAMVESVNTQANTIVTNVNQQGTQFATDVNRSMDNMATAVNTKVSGIGTDFSTVRTDIGKAADASSVQAAINAIAGSQVTYTLTGDTLNINTSAATPPTVASVTPGTYSSAGSGGTAITATHVSYGTVTGGTATAGTVTTGTAQAGTANNVDPYSAEAITPDQVTGSSVDAQAVTSPDVEAGADITTTDLTAGTVEAKPLTKENLTSSQVRAELVKTGQVKVDLVKASEIKIAEIKIDKITPKLIKLTRKEK